jgi:predicted GH43/DUF377 family glycosyl hydrolase
MFEPRLGVAWEVGGVMAPAVVKLDDGYLMLYRAFGHDRKSRLGRATSHDGLSWKREDEPILVPQDELEAWGVEDPRLVVLDGRLVVTYTAATGHQEADGWHWSTRIRFASSSLEDRFGSGVEYITPKLPNKDNKDAALFPQSVDGSYWLLHRIMPDIWISRSDDLVTWTDHQVLLPPQGDGWEALRIGAGATPIRTELGWLVFYHGVSIDLTYSMSVFVLDLDDPTKVRYQLPYPLIVPIEDYELRGLVAKVIFGTSVTDEGDRWRLYYGGADSVVAGAEINKADLLDALKDYPV